MPREDDDRYLWDRSGEPDPEVLRLERLLARQRYVPRPFSAGAAPARWRAIAFALAASLAVAAGIAAWLSRPGPQGYAVEGLAGVSRARVGERIETGASASAVVRVAWLGQVEVAPRTSLRVDDDGERAHRLYLERGRVHARIAAEPGLFQIGTPAGLSIDMGCVYDLAVDDDGRSSLAVETGRVAFEEAGRRVLVPAGATCASTPGGGPDVPVRIEAEAAFVAAVRAIERAAEPDPALVERVLDADVREESVTLWHLYANAESSELRRAAFERLARAYPLPDDADRGELARGAGERIDEWREIVARDWR